MANVRIVSGATSVNSENLVGQTVARVRRDCAVVLGLVGGESSDVESVGQPTFRAVDDNYVIRDGDTLRFTRTAGEKGSC